MKMNMKTSSGMTQPPPFSSCVPSPATLPVPLYSPRVACIIAVNPLLIPPA
jgi:hypothetical protein